MTRMSKTIVFFGTEDFSLTALQALIKANYDIAVVITKPDSKKGRGQHVTPPSVKVLALQHGIPVLQPTKVSDINDEIRKLNPVAGVLVSYGKIIPQSTIDLFTPGIINIHPSLLPKYRGPSPIESAIKNGDSDTGVSIMQLEAGMDSGPVYGNTTYNLSGHETSTELYSTLANIGADLLLKKLPDILDGSLLPKKQLEKDATYCSMLSKNDSLLDLQNLTSKEAERRIRAYLEFPKSKLVFQNHTIIITKAHISKDQKTPLSFLCQDGAYLTIDELIAPSGRRMDAAAFLRGYAAA
jgi:methionyl-tRNA formyltransferase